MITNGQTMSMTRGDSESIRVRIADHPFSEGHIIEMTVRKSVKKDKALYKKITEFEEDGSAIINIKPEDTSDLKFGKYMYDIQWTDSHGNVKTIVKPTSGNFNITEEVSY